MWRTPLGERALEGAEWALFREGLGVLWDQVEMALECDEPEMFRTGVKAFDRLGAGQKLAMLALVGRAMRDAVAPPPGLTSVVEGTVGAVFALIREELEMEIDASAEAIASDDPERAAIATLWRGLIRAADVEVEELPAATSVDEGVWESMIDEVSDAVLWDADYEMEDLLMDGDPGDHPSDAGPRELDDGYFVGIAPDPTERQLAEVRRVLGEICGSEEPA